MDAQSFIAASKMTDAELAKEYGCSRSYWTHVRNGSKALGKPTAIRIYRKTSKRVGPLENVSARDIGALERLLAA